MNLYPIVQDARDGERLSDYHRHGDDDELQNRRRIVALSMVASAAMAAISLYQFGLLKKVPGLPLGKWFDGCKVNASPEAYQSVRTPDAFLGLVSYAATAALAAMGGPDRARRAPWIPIALAGKVTLDAAVAAKLTVDQPKKYRAFCELCLTAALATFATVPLAYREARVAVKHLDACGAKAARGGRR